jgi:predicted RNase H-like HicB family nuclease
MAKKHKSPRYTVIIQWSEEDQRYVASLPEWAPHAYTGASGVTYEEAAKNAREVLELLMEDENGKPVDLPPEKHFHYPGADVIDLPEERFAQSTGKITAKKSRRSA